MISRWFPSILTTVAIVAGAWGFWTLLHQSPSQDLHSDSASHEEASAELASSVTLPAEKLAAAGIELSPARIEMIGERRHVPGRLQYDDLRHIEVKASTPGILSEVRVKPGDQVTQGQILAIVSSPEVGHARAEVLKRQAEYELAVKKRDWEQAACDGVKKLVENVKRGAAVKEISDSMQDVLVGQSRNEILTAYSRFLLAENIVASLRSASDTGAVPSRTVQERVSERDAAEVGLKAIMEQTLFETSQRCQAAQLEVDDVQRRLRISQQQVQTLLGYEEALSLMEATEALSHVEVRAPFAGTIESKRFSAAERVSPSDSLFVLADTSRLWVVADIREQEWPALTLQPGQAIEVTAPALGEQTFQAALYYIGREVDPSSNAVPLVATIDNSAGLLRPGQYLQIEVPLGPEHSALLIPDSALMEHEGERFVFVPEEDKTSFRKVTVKTGISSHGRIEVLDGLSELQQVVSKGAFALKSELLLESESE